MIHFGLNNWKCRKSKCFWLLGLKFICRLCCHVTDSVMRCVVSLGKSLFSEIAWTLILSYLQDCWIPLPVGQNPNEAAWLCLFCIKEMKKERRVGRRKERRKRTKRPKGRFSGDAKQISKFHTRMMLGIWFTFRAESLLGTGTWMTKTQIRCTLGTCLWLWTLTTLNSAANHVKSCTLCWCLRRTSTRARGVGFHSFLSFFF